MCSLFLWGQAQILILEILYSIPACPVGPADRTGVAKIFPFLELEPRLNIKYGFNPDGINRKINSIGQAGRAKMNIFQRSQML